MSVEAIKKSCVGCGACEEVCPGGLIRISGGKAVIDRPELCWGCASCIKECPNGALRLYISPDAGGLGGRLGATQAGEKIKWTAYLADGREVVVVTDSRESNKY
ncbi:MAG: ferredoxin family protein [Clostridiales bacterium]|jgi:adenylylsulfate reductase subunit B|nr:ferredoxin family protein [Clostridiales bacterium]